MFLWCFSNFLRYCHFLKPLCCIVTLGWLYCFLTFKYILVCLFGGKNSSQWFVYSSIKIIWSGKIINVYLMLHLRQLSLIYSACCHLIFHIFLLSSSSTWSKDFLVLLNRGLIEDILLSIFYFSYITSHLTYGGELVIKLTWSEWANPNKFAH